MTTPETKTKPPIELCKGVKYDVLNPFVEYNDDNEYRQKLHKIFMVSTKINEDDPTDYDPIINNTLSVLFEKTKNNSQFQTLYKMAAAKMISTDQTIGQCVLYSYDYLYLFHPCTCLFLSYPEMFNEDVPYFKQLVEKLSEK